MGRDVKRSSPSPVPRPTAPDPGLLEDAAARLRIEGLATGPVDWVVVERLERPKSTVFVLDARADGSTSRWYYKVDVVHVGGREHAGVAAARRRSLEAEQQLSAPLAERADGLFRTDESLLLDPEQLIAIRRHVAGQPLGKTVGWARPGRRRRAPSVYTAVGAALRTFEDVGRTRPAPIDAETLGRRLSGSLDAARDVLSDRATRWARQTIEELGPLVAAQGLTWQHGDISPTNVLVDGDIIGVIDVSWRPQLPCWDLVRLVMRLECESPQIRPWTSTLLDRVLDGYGLDRDDPGPSWQLARLERCLLAVREPHPIVRRRGLDGLLALANGDRY